MNRLIRMVYGRSGTRMQGVLVSYPRMDSAADPRWLSALVIAVVLGVFLLVTRLVNPDDARQLTVIDPSKLEIVLPPEPPPRVDPKTVGPAAQPRLREGPKPVPQVHPAESPRPAQAPIPPQPPAFQQPVRPAPSPQAPRIAERRAVPPPEPVRPVLNLSRALRPADNPAYQPRPEFTRRLPGTEEPVPVSVAPVRRNLTQRELPAAPRQTQAARVRIPTAEALPATGSDNVRAAPWQEAPATSAAITQRKPLTGPAEPPAAPARPGAMRRRQEAESPAGSAQPRVARKAPAPPLPQASQAPAPPASRTALKARAEEAGEPLGVKRGVSLAAMALCSTTQAEEDAVKALLRVVGARESCSSGDGEYLFRGTRRVSSFNLIIIPVRGRTPGNRCEELENAYRCLKNR